MKGQLYIKNYFIIIATLFLVLLQPLHALQHVYHDILVSNTEHVDDSHLHKHDHHKHVKKCAVCEFTFQPYIVAEVTFVPPAIAQIISIKINTPVSQYLYNTQTNSYLRGPPAKFLV